MLANAYSFNSDEQGIRQFSSYLLQTPNWPTYLLVDIIEEEYKEEVIPHMHGKDRKAIIKHRQSRLFRDSPYCHAIMQGRETSGRRDDKVLLTSLINPARLGPWLELLHDHRNPLAGIYSLPILSKLLLDKLTDKQDTTLLVTLQRGSGLRQSFFSNGQFKLSRLVRIPRLDSAKYAGFILAEIEKVRLYLNSLGALSQTKPLEVYVLSHGTQLTRLKQESDDSTLTHFNILDVSHAAKQIGIVDPLATTYADSLYAHLLLKNPPKNHYATPKETFYHRLQHMRTGMLATSVLVGLVGVVWGGMNFIDGLSYKQQATSVAQQANYYQARYHLAREKLPVTPVEPTDLKGAVQIIETLKTMKTTPHEMMKIISYGLAGFPELQVDTFQWLASSDPSASVGRFGQRSPDRRTNQDLDDNKSGPGRYHIVHLKGHIDPFEGDYREALDLVNRFAVLLEKTATIKKVTRVRMPLDISPEATMTGAASTALGNQKPTFELKILAWRVFENA